MDLMSDQVQEAVVALVENLAGGPQPAPLHVTWFGGEPLLAMRIITALTERLQALETAGKIAALRHDLCVTNGYGLTPEVARELDRLGIRKFQITLDGPPEHHDARRFVKGSRRGTFDTITANIARLPESFGKVEIRVNIDRTNAGQGLGVFDALDEAGVLDRVRVHFRRVKAYSEHAMRSDDNLMREEEFSVWFQQTAHAALARGLPVESTAPKPSIHGVCQVDSSAGFVVHPNGTLYRCYAELGNDGHAVGSVLKAKSWASLGYAAYQLRDPFDDPDCCACWLLPTCVGGCPLTRNLNRRLGMGKQCPAYKYHFEKMILRTYGRTDRLVVDMSEESE